MSKAWMPLYIGDYLRDTQHLSVAEHGAYLLLIMHYWQHGGLPTDEREVLRVAKMGSNWFRHREAIASLFQPGWKHKRIDKELARAQEIANKRAVFGAIGGRKNKGRHNAKRHLDKLNGEAIASLGEKQTDAPQSHIKKEVDERVVDNVDKSTKPKLPITDELRANIERKWLGR